MITLVRVGDETRTITVGAADVAAKRPIVPDATFPIASVTKSMVATAVMQQVEDGKLGLDDTVAQWLPKIVTKGDRITIRQLLSHRSGIHEPREDEVPPGVGPLSDRDIVRLFGTKPLDFEPGTSAAYSNFGYVILGMILEKVTGHSVGEALGASIFERADMNDTELAPRQRDVLGYAGGKDVTADAGLEVFQAAGSVVSTVKDVDRFYQHLWAGELLSTKLVEEMSRPVGDIPPYLGQYGLGIWSRSVSCGTALGHAGSAPGYSVQTWTLQGSKRSVVVLVNEGAPVGFSISDLISDTALCS